MSKTQQLAEQLQLQLGSHFETVELKFGEVTVEVRPEKLLELCLKLRDLVDFKFAMLVDVCGVDYQTYGLVEWATESTTETGFSRAAEQGADQQRVVAWDKPRFAVVYHLLSLTHNRRLRVRCLIDGEPPMVDSVCDIWNSANWFEREAYDLYGILFKGHPDLRRILTDYGFIGHPFRKDFPLSGHVEMRYDAETGRVIYQPVEIEPRVLVPRVSRFDNRHAQSHEVKNG